MGKSSKTQKNDELIGLTKKIDRRDFLNSALLGAGGLLYSMTAPAMFNGKPSQLLPKKVQCDWYGVGGVGDSRTSHGNTPDILKAAHAVRDGLLTSDRAKSVPVSENYDLVIVGGGLAGLGAAQRLVELNPDKNCLILENHPIFGGEAKRNEFNVNGEIIAAPQGSNSFYYNTKFDFDEDRKYIELLGVPVDDFRYSKMLNNPKKMVFSQEHYDVQLWAEEYISKGHFVDQQSHNVDPQWIKDPWRNNLKDYPVSDKIKKDLLAWKYATNMPASDKKTKAWLDNMTYKDYIEKVMGLDEAVTKYADPVIASAGGMGCDVMSAYTAQLLGMYGVARDEPVKPENRHSFPGGNDGFARHFVKLLIPEAIHGKNTFEDIMQKPINFGALDRAGQSVRCRLSSNVVDVTHIDRGGSAESVDVTYYKSGELYKVNAKAVVMASGGWINRRIISDLPSSHAKAYSKFNHAPMLVANVALNNWRFLDKLGITACQWSGGFGYHTNIRSLLHVGSDQPDLDPNKPIVLTFYVSFEKPNEGYSAQQQSRLGQMELLSKSYMDYEREIRQQMIKMFGGSGFDARRDIAGIILNRWGHAYVTPTPGFFFDKAGGPGYADIIKSEPHGRISFGHSEVRGYQHWGPAAAEGSRAVDQVYSYL